MKTTALLFVCIAAAAALHAHREASAQGRIPLYNAYLASPLDGEGHEVTNLNVRAGSVVVTGSVTVGNASISAADGYYRVGDATYGEDRIEVGGGGLLLMTAGTTNINVSEQELYGQWWFGHGAELWNRSWCGPVNRWKLQSDNSSWPLRLEHVAVFDKSCEGHFSVYRTNVIAFLSEVQRMNQRGNGVAPTAETNYWYEASPGVWTNRTQWTCYGSVTGNVLTLSTAWVHRLVSPYLSNGVSEVSFHSYGGYGSLNMNVELSDDGVTWTTQRTVLVASGTNGMSVNSGPTYLALSHAGIAIPVPDPDATPVIVISNLYVDAWSNYWFLGENNDSAGLRVLVDDATGEDGREAVNTRTLERRLVAVDWAIDAINPDYVGVSLSTNMLRYGPRWTTQEEGENLMTRYAGQSFFDCLGGGTVTPQVVRFQVTPTSGVITAWGIEDMPHTPQWTTNGSAWVAYDPGQYTAAYTQKLWTTEFPLLDDYTWYRVIATGDVLSSVQAVLHADLEVDGSINGAVWVTNVTWHLNAQTNLVGTTNIYLGRSP